MKRTLSVVLMMALVLGAFAATPAGAKKKKVKAVPVTLYAHGNAPFGEADAPDGVSGIYMKMDTTEPAAGAPKSMNVTNAGVTPNPNCAGNPLFPMWVGEVAGHIKGEMKFTFHAVSSPGQVEVRVWPDISTLSCNEGYVEPQAGAIVDLPPGPGTVEVDLGKVDFKALGRVLVQISPVQPGAAQSRVLYDSADFATQLSFSCIPASGTSCTP